MMKIYIVAVEVRVDWIRGCCKATTDGLMALCTTRRPSAHSKKEESFPNVSLRIFYSTAANASSSR
jgi:hypothetical protein